MAAGIALDVGPRKDVLDGLEPRIRFSVPTWMAPMSKTSSPQDWILPGGIALDTQGTGSAGGGGSSGDGGSSGPDLIVESPSISDNTLTPGQSFTLRATVRNRGTARSAATTLRYYRSVQF